jgi:flavin-dependent dehydrogenase
VIIIPLKTKHEFDNDVIVTGAGPAGSTAAHYFATAGYDVIIVDQQKFPRDSHFKLPRFQKILLKLIEKSTPTELLKKHRKANT